MKRIFLIVCLLFLCSACAINAPAIPACQVEPQWPPLTEPPQMVIDTGSMLIDIGCSSAQWEYDENPKDDLATAVIACGDHPLNRKDTMTRLPITGESVELSFPGGHRPDLVSIRCWSTDHWGNPEAPAESFTMDSHNLRLRDSGTVYEITAVWESYSQFSGEATYCFAVEP